MREHRREFRIFSRSSLFDSAAIREQAERMAAQDWLVGIHASFLQRKPGSHPH